MKSILDIYSRGNGDETFIDFLSHDLDDGAVWFNNSEFARFHDINGKQLLSVLTYDTRDKNIKIQVGSDQNWEGVTKSTAILFCRVHDLKKGVKSGSQIKVDGRLYTVSEAILIQEQIWRITLETNNS